MISNLAKETIEQFKEEGLDPTFEDCVRLNALGLKIEHGENAADLAALPRMAFLGDLILWEPTIAARQWLDAASHIVASDYYSQLTLTAFALNTPFGDLPLLNKSSNIISSVKEFADNELGQFTESQVLCAVEYALNGCDPTSNEEAELTANELESRKNIKTIPQPMRSAARHVFAEAVAMSIPDAEKFTIDALDSIVTTAVALKGRDALEGRNGRYTADFYRTADKIHERLKAEKGNGEE